MYCRTSLFVLLVLLKSNVIAGYNVPELCGGYDVSGDPRVEPRQVDGLWYSQGTLTSRFPYLALVFIENQGQVLWGSYWNSTTKTCTHVKSINTQLQSLERGPFSACFSSKPVLPIERLAVDWVIFYPTNNLFMFFRCFGEFKNGRCSEQPYARIMTRTLDITPKEKSIIDKRLRQFGESIHSVIFSNPRENGCPRPMQQERRRRYGR